MLYRLKSLRINPFDGEAFLISAIKRKPLSLALVIADLKSRGCLTASLLMLFKSARLVFNFASFRRSFFR
ncbi:hypothetical protein MCHI_000056 [Candidatus Magnetoovum chiemensis]|nr:hypothetical protein MCHI_000056 [Candidatus Magnetoovum chiemensis]